MSFCFEFFGIDANCKLCGPDRTTTIISSLEGAVERAKSMMRTSRFPLAGRAVQCVIRSPEGTILREVTAKGR
jgi:hypothetical protein